LRALGAEELDEHALARTVCDVSLRRIVPALGWLRPFAVATTIGAAVVRVTAVGRIVDAGVTGRAGEAGDAAAENLVLHFGLVVVDRLLRSRTFRRCRRATHRDGRCRHCQAHDRRKLHDHLLRPLERAQSSAPSYVRQAIFLPRYADPGAHVRWCTASVGRGPMISRLWRPLRRSPRRALLRAPRAASSRGD